MKKIFLIILTIASFSAFSQKNDDDLKTQINSQIKTVTLSPGRVGAVLDSIVDGKQSLYADPKTITGTTYTVQNFDVGKTLHATHASGTTITITNTLPANMVFNVVRDAGAGTVTFVSGGTASLSTIGGELTLESEVIAVTWIKKTATVFQGFGALGPAAGGGSVTDVTGTTNRITSTGGTTPQIDISTSYAGQNSITNVGTLTAGATGVGFTIALGTSTVTGLGTGVLTALGVNVGSAGSVVVNGGALGTPSSGVATNLTGTASGLTAGTVTTNANLTGDVTSTGNATAIASGVIVDADVNASAAIAGTKIANTPAGSIAATTAQAAINELDGEKLASTATTIGAQDLFISAVAMWPRVTGGSSSLAQTEVATSLFNVQTLDFDQTTQEFAQMQFVFPRNWNHSTITATVYWTAGSGSGGVVWGISGGAYSDSDVMTAALGTAQTVTDTFVAANDVHITSTSSAITLAGSPQDADFIALQISRNPADGSDTLNADAKLLGIRIVFTLDAGTSE